MQARNATNPRPRVLQAPLPLASISDVLPNLLVSGVVSPADFSDSRITHILSLLSTHDVFPWLVPSNIHHTCIECVDSPTWNLLDQLPEICDYLREAMASGGTVLVHCVSGISRSPSAVVGYLIFEHQMPFHQALAFVKSKRDCISPNLGFVRQLSMWATMCRTREQESPDPIVVTAPLTQGKDSESTKTDADENMIVEPRPFYVEDEPPLSIPEMQFPKRVERTPTMSEVVVEVQERRVAEEEVVTELDQSTRTCCVVV